MRADNCGLMIFLWSNCEQISDNLTQRRDMEKIEGWGSPSDQYEVINQK